MLTRSDAARWPALSLRRLLCCRQGIVWWASAMHSTLQTEVATNERQDTVLEALKVDVQVKADRFSEAQRVLSEQLVEQRADLRAIRELMQRIEGRLDQTTMPRRM